MTDGIMRRRPVLFDKATALARSGRDLPERVRIKANGLLDRFSPPNTIQRIARADQLESLLEGMLGCDLKPDAHLQELETEIESRWSELDGATPFNAGHRGTATLGRLCYLVCRVLKPETVVETGVAYGITSAYILQALAANCRGRLVSVDLPPLDSEAENNVGCLIPTPLKSRWDLIRGSARKVLPEALRGAGSIDVFVHDSLHTYSHMKWEFAVAIAALRPGGILIADDIHGNRAFEELSRDSGLNHWFAIAQTGKQSVCGALRMDSAT